MNTKHTPGPWEHDRTSGYRCTVRSACGRKVALTDGLQQEPRGNSADYQAWRKNNQRVNEANARLIAASPCMLALLIELIDIEGPQPGTATWANKVKAAIAKATGEAR